MSLSNSYQIWTVNRGTKVFVTTNNGRDLYISLRIKSAKTIYNAKSKYWNWILITKPKVGKTKVQKGKKTTPGKILSWKEQVHEGQGSLDYQVSEF
jgi:hypothetical protein